MSSIWFTETKNGEILESMPSAYGVGCNGNSYFLGSELDGENILKNIVAETVALSLSFLHCKNVVVKTDNQPQKLLKAKKRRNRPAVIRYHTLEIKPMVKVIRETGSEKIGLRHALHICRGHFKDYSNGNGLFGKYKGLYWWDMHTRGSIEEGIALKDYKVSTC